MVHVDYLSLEVSKEIDAGFYAGLYNSGNERREVLNPVSMGEAGGGKVFTGTVFAGSYNHLDSTAFIEWFSSIPWSTHSHAVLSISTESDFYTVYRLPKGKLIRIAGWSSDEI